MAAPIANARIVVAIEHLRQSAAVKLATAGACTDQIIATADLIAAAFKTEGKLLLCGNGGSAADCQHMAAEFTSRLSADFLHPGLPALALTTDTSFLTAYDPFHIEASLRTNAMGSLLQLAKNAAVFVEKTRQRRSATGVVIWFVCRDAERRWATALLGSRENSSSLG